MSKFDTLNAFPGVEESVRRRPAAHPVAGFSAAPEEVGRERSKNVWTIEVDRIVPDPDQPRKEFDPEALDRLAASLKAKGQLQPIQVRWDAGMERYIVLMGERRWRAANVAGIAKLQCVVRDAPLSEEEKLALQLVENCLREDLSPIEQARAYRTLMTRQGWTQDDLAGQLSVSRTLVIRALSLLKLPDAIQNQVEQGGLTASHAYEISKLADPAAQIRLAETAVEQGLTRDDVAKQARDAPKRAKGKPTTKRLPAVAVYRLGGYRIEIGRKAGIDPATAADALQEAAERLRASITPAADQEAA